jgi:hypothetical protein
MIRLEKMSDRPVLHLSKQIGALLVILFALKSALAIPLVNASGNYYVAPNGSDANPGTLTAPFRTIQKCADIAVAGDTCFIRTGIYRETVIVPRSGAAGNSITFKAYNGEEVTVSGADVITGWTLHTGQIYQAAMSWDLNVRQWYPNAQVSNNQIFVDGQMMVEARWPNIPAAAVTRLTNANNARAASASVVNSFTAAYHDPALNTFPANYWLGAKINFIPGWKTVSTTCDVTASTPGSISFLCNPDPGANGLRFEWSDPGGVVFRPNAGNPYYLWGKFEALDYPGEWFRNISGTLYLWTPDGSNPAAHTIEARRRLWAFDVRNRDYITIDGIKLFAATIRTDSNTDHLLIQNIEARYLWHFQQIPPRWSLTGIFGIDLNGNDNTLRHSYLAYSAGPLLDLGGRRNLAENNVIHDGEYMANAPLITASFPDQSGSAGADKNILRQNTIFHGGNRLISAGPGLDITYNDVYSSHLQISDLGVIYNYDIDGLGSNIAYNLVHDNWAELDLDLSFYGGYGIYLDDYTRNYAVYRNVVWNTTSDGLFVFGVDPALYPDSNRWFFNNTVDGRIGARLKTGQTLNGTEFKNNYAVASLFNDPGVALQNNRIEDLVVNQPKRDYSLRPDSPAINAGAVLPGYTDGYAGSAPDVGAYEYGQPSFIAGAVLRPQDLARLLVTCSANVGDTAHCTISNLPLGRKLPGDFQLRIGSSGIPYSTCFTRMDYGTHFGAGECAHVSTAGLTGIQPIYLKIGMGSWQNSGATVDLGTLAITAITPPSGPHLGGTQITITGRRFDPAFAGYIAPITLSNASGTPLYNYQVLVKLNTAGLIASGKLRSDCGDLRFSDGSSNLEYWLEEGCNTANTRVWVKVPVVPVGSSAIEVRYGAPLSASASNGRSTFAFFDDFSDGFFDTTFWSGSSAPWYSLVESDGAMRITGTTSAANQYDRAYLYLKSSAVWFPASFAIDSELTVVQSPPNFKSSVGSGDLNFYGSSLPKRLGFWQSGIGWVQVGQSTVSSATFTDRKLSIGYTGPTNNRTIRWLENGDLTTVRASRSGLNNPSAGTFDFGPDTVASFDVRFDNIRVRTYVYPEPVVTVGTETASGMRVTVDGQPCTNVVVLDSGRLTCIVPPHPVGAVDVTVINPNAQTFTLPEGFVYYLGNSVYVPLIWH